MQSQPQYEVQLELPVGFSYNSESHNQLADGTCCSPVETECFTGCNQTEITLCFRETSITAHWEKGQELAMVLLPLCDRSSTTTTYPVSVAGCRYIIVIAL